jgi:hypothetical protein
METEQATKTYSIEVKWNREFVFQPWGQNSYTDLQTAGAVAESLKDIGDGASVKDTRVVDEDGVVVWQYGKPAKPRKTQPDELCAYCERIGFHNRTYGDRCRRCDDFPRGSR